MDRDNRLDFRAAFSSMLPINSTSNRAKSPSGDGGGGGLNLIRILDLRDGPFREG